MVIVFLKTIDSRKMARPHAAANAVAARLTFV